MTDEEATSSEADAYMKGLGQAPPTRTAFNAGFRRGLLHARRWLPLTSDPATWPEEGQRVLMLDAEEDETRVVVWPRTTNARGWSHWSPLPEKSP